MSITPDQALQKMERFCAYRERCPKEVRSKLKEMGLSRADSEQIYQVLQEDNFFNEERFAMAYAGGKFRSNQWGRVRIRQELKMRSIAPEYIAKALDAIPEEEYEALVRKLMDRKMQQYEGDDNARDKTIASLSRAGFELDLLFRLFER
ncbi:MAG: RecX family transcriptional regulator [Chitinophagales bacterium]|nr:RecX family transcriptional regulator [Chitinophagales bacterium]